MKRVFCRESGLDCDYIIEGHTEDELFRNGEKHAFNKHGIKSSEFILYLTKNLDQKLKGKHSSL